MKALSARTLFGVQGSYYALTALWGLVDIHSFMLVTGPKVDTWLVKTVSLLILAIAIPQLEAAYSKRESFSLVLLSLFSAFALAAVDIYYSAVQRISPVYLGDAFMEILILLGWFAVLKSSPRNSPKRRNADCGAAV